MQSVALRKIILAYLITFFNIIYSKVSWYLFKNVAFL